MDLYEGAIVEVTVSSVEEFGVIVELENKKGVILVPNIYWDYYEVTRRMFETFKPGMKVLVKVLAVTPEKFSASIKHLNPEQNPWRDSAIYTLGSVHKGIVRLIFDFGAAIVMLKNGADVVVEKVESKIAINDSVDVAITAVNIERKRIDGRLV